jgi:hypothetical protein
MIGLGLDNGRIALRLLERLRNYFVLQSVQIDFEADPVFCLAFAWEIYVGA